MSPELRSYRLLIVKELKKLTGRLSSTRSPLYDPVTFTLRNSGKLIRPVLVMTACRMFCGNAKRTVHAALAFELFHDFTLIHDDIMDRSSLRRKKPTVFKKWGSNTAILSGDAMLILALQELDKIPPGNKQEVFDVFFSNALKVCEGQEMDMRFEKLKTVSEKMYMDMIRKKTAALLGASLQAGALIGGASMKESRKLYEYGNLIGMAFQVKDDLLDAFGNKRETGKNKGSDIRNRKKNWLWVRAHAMGKGPDKINKVKDVIRMYQAMGLQAEGMKKQQELLRKADRILKSVTCPGSRKTDLVFLTKWLSTRES